MIKKGINRMKNVLIIIGKLKIGGAEKIGRDIGYYADKSKYNIHYLVFTDEIGSYEEELIDAGCKIHHMAPPSYGYISYCINIYRLLKAESIDIIHSHTMFNSGWIMMISRYMGIPVRISHSHSIKGPEHRGFLKNRYENTMRRLINRYSTQLVACGAGAGAWLYGKEVFEKRGTLIYNGIELSEFTFSEASRRKIRSQYHMDDAFVIGHVGHLATVKNQVFLIQIMPEICKQIPNTLLLLLGDGKDREMLEKKAEELGMRNRVIFTGNVKNVGEYMSAMDVFAFPSLYEGMPLALVEAQTCGLPCIISDKIPKDVYLTDLIQSCSLERKGIWVDSIVKARRKEPVKYSRQMYDMGFDTSGMLQKIYQLYDDVE